jgi:D-aminopeptidase
MPSSARRTTAFSTTSAHGTNVIAAVRAASAGPVAEGCVGDGTGTRAFDWKGGIGTSSRVLPKPMGGYTVGVLVQTSHGGVLKVAGATSRCCRRR